MRRQQSTISPFKAVAKRLKHDHKNIKGNYVQTGISLSEELTTEFDEDLDFKAVNKAFEDNNSALSSTKYKGIRKIGRFAILQSFIAQNGRNLALEDFLKILAKAKLDLQKVNILQARELEYAAINSFLQSQTPPQTEFLIEVLNRTSCLITKETFAHYNQAQALQKATFKERLQIFKVTSVLSEIAESTSIFANLFYPSGQSFVYSVEQICEIFKAVRWERESVIAVNDLLNRDLIEEFTLEQIDEIITGKKITREDGTRILSRFVEKNRSCTASDIVKILQKNLKKFYKIEQNLLVVRKFFEARSGQFSLDEVEQMLKILPNSTEDGFILYYVSDIIYSAISSNFKISLPDFIGLVIRLNTKQYTHGLIKKFLDKNHQTLSPEILLSLKATIESSSNFAQDVKNNIWRILVEELLKQKGDDISYADILSAVGSAPLFDLDKISEYISKFESVDQLVVLLNKSTDYPRKKLHLILKFINNRENKPDDLREILGNKDFIKEQKLNSILIGELIYTLYEELSKTSSSSQRLTEIFEIIGKIYSNKNNAVEEKITIEILFQIIEKTLRSAPDQDQRQEELKNLRDALGKLENSILQKVLLKFGNSDLSAKDFVSLIPANIQIPFFASLYPAMQGKTAQDCLTPEALADIKVLGIAPEIEISRLFFYYHSKSDGRLESSFNDRTKAAFKKSFSPSKKPLVPTAADFLKVSKLVGDEDVRHHYIDNGTLCKYFNSRLEPKIKIFSSGQRKKFKIPGIETVESEFPGIQKKLKELIATDNPSTDQLTEFFKLVIFGPAGGDFSKNPVERTAIEYNMKSFWNRDRDKILSLLELKDGLGSFLDCCNSITDGCAANIGSQLTIALYTALLESDRTAKEKEISLNTDALMFSFLVERIIDPAINNEPGDALLLQRNPLKLRMIENLRISPSGLVEDFFEYLKSSNLSGKSMGFLSEKLGDAAYDFLEKVPSENRESYNDAIIKAAAYCMIKSSAALIKTPENLDFGFGEEINKALKEILDKALAPKEAMHEKSLQQLVPHAKYSESQV